MNEMAVFDEDSVNDRYVGDECISPQEASQTVRENLK